MVVLLQLRNKSSWSRATERGLNAYLCSWYQRLDYASTYLWCPQSLAIISSLILSYFYYRKKTLNRLHIIFTSSMQWVFSKTKINGLSVTLHFLVSKTEARKNMILEIFEILEILRKIFLKLRNFFHHI